MVSVKTLEPTAEKKTLTVSERRGWTETRYLPQAVSYSGDTDWSKVARETVLPDRRPRRVKERNGNVAPRSGKGSGRNGNVAPRNRQAPATARVNYEDDDWQPTSDSAHLEGITRSMKRDGRQQRWGATPGFAARLGQPFDPNFHQAVMRVEDADAEDGTITQVLQKGYQAKGRVIRPAMVQVAGN